MIPTGPFARCREQVWNDDRFGIGPVERLQNRLFLCEEWIAAQAKKDVQDYFGWIPKGADIVRNFTPEAPQTSERYTEVEEKITPLPAIAYAWRTVPEGDKDQYALDLLTNVFAQGNSSRLVKRLKDKDQLVVNINPVVLN